MAAVTGERTMVLGYVFVGMIGGSISFAAALLLGASLWSAILTYSLAGAISTLILPIARLTSNAATHVTQSDTIDSMIDTPATQHGAHNAPSVAEPVLQPTATTTMKILAVDDDPFILELVPKIAAQVGCPDITTVRSGAEAMATIALADKPFECFLLDINMPGMDGIELCARIRATPGYEDASIIMLTAMTDTAYLERAFLAGANDYTSKPFDVIEFGERMQSAQAWKALKRSDVRGEVGPSVAGNNPFRSRHGAAKLLPGLEKAPILINDDALQNYLAHLPTSDQVSAYVMAIVFDQVAPSGDGLPSQQVLTGLTHVAAAIDDLFKADGYVMSVADEGRFVIASRGLNVPAAHMIEAGIQDRLDKQQITTGGESEDFPKISVGSAVRPGGRNKQRARKAIDSAIHLAEVRRLHKTGSSPLAPAISA